VILTVWSVLNLVLSAWIMTDTLFPGDHTPALYLRLTEAEVNALDSDILATMDSIAVFANGLNVTFCFLALCVIWLGLACRHTRSFPGLLVGFSAALIAGIAADYAVGILAP